MTEAVSLGSKMLFGYFICLVYGVVEPMCVCVTDVVSQIVSQIHEAKML